MEQIQPVAPEINWRNYAEKHVGKTAHFTIKVGSKSETFIAVIEKIEYYYWFIRYNCGDFSYWEDQIKFVELTF